LGLLEAETGQGPDFFDDLDLLVTGGLEDDVELVLLLDLLRGAAGAVGRGRGYGHRGRGLDVERLLELLHELRQLEQRHHLERVEQFVVAELRHRVLPLSPCVSFPRLPGPAGRRPASPPAPRAAWPSGTAAPRTSPRHRTSLPSWRRPAWP